MPETTTGLSILNTPTENFGDPRTRVAMQNMEAQQRYTPYQMFQQSFNAANLPVEQQMKQQQQLQQIQGQKMDMAERQAEVADKMYGQIIDAYGISPELGRATEARLSPLLRNILPEDQMAQMGNMSGGGDMAQAANQAWQTKLSHAAQMEAAQHPDKWHTTDSGEVSYSDAGQVRQNQPVIDANAAKKSQKEALDAAKAQDDALAQQVITGKASAIGQVSKDANGIFFGEGEGRVNVTLPKAGVQPIPQLSTPEKNVVVDSRGNVYEMQNAAQTAQQPKQFHEGLVKMPDGSYAQPYIDPNNPDEFKFTKLPKGATPVGMTGKFSNLKPADKQAAITSLREIANDPNTPPASRLKALEDINMLMESVGGGQGATVGRFTVQTVNQ